MKRQTALTWQVGSPIIGTRLTFMTEPRHHDIQPSIGASTGELHLLDLGRARRLSDPDAAWSRKRRQTPTRSVQYTNATALRPRGPSTSQVDVGYAVQPTKAFPGCAQLGRRHDPGTALRHWPKAGPNQERERKTLREKFFDSRKHRGQNGISTPSISAAASFGPPNLYIAVNLIFLSVEVKWPRSRDGGPSTVTPGASPSPNSSRSECPCATTPREGNTSTPPGLSPLPADPVRRGP